MITLGVDFLNGLKEPTKMAPYTNVYFINSETEAHNFQENNPFDYDINNSIKNTHSRNGLIKFNKEQYVYLGLENESYKDPIYVNLEVVSIQESIKYYQLKRKELGIKNKS